MNHEVVIAKLSELGWSRHDTLVYLAALEKPESSAGEILDKVKLHREQVYRALKRLVDEGFLVIYKKRGRSYYSPLDPKILVRKTKVQLDTAQAVIPYLEALRGRKAHAIRVLEGQNIIADLFSDILATIKSGEEYLVLGGIGQAFFELAQKELSAYAVQFKKKKINARILAYTDQDLRSELNVAAHAGVKKLPYPMLGAVATVVYRNKVAIEILDPANPSLIIIENGYIATAYRQNFDMLWKIAK